MFVSRMCLLADDSQLKHVRTQEWRTVTQTTILVLFEMAVHVGPSRVRIYPGISGSRRTKATILFRIEENISAAGNLLLCL